MDGLIVGRRRERGVWPSSLIVGWGGGATRLTAVRRRGAMTDSTNGGCKSATARDGSGHGGRDASSRTRGADGKG